MSKIRLKKIKKFKKIELEKSFFRKICKPPDFTNRGKNRFLLDTAVFWRGSPNIGKNRDFKIFLF